jgi:hypothetical protein
MPPSKDAPKGFKYAAHTAWRRVENESIVLDLNSSVYYSLNDTASFIWEKLGTGASLSEIAAAVASEFDVTKGEASKDIGKVVEMLRKEKLLVPAE